MSELSHVNSVSTSEAVTRNIRVRVVAQYAPAQSQPLQNHWFFYYTIDISNEGTETVQLISRRWIITDADGQTQEVRGLGVVGQQPLLEPGESFEYTSGCPLGTASGMMQGTYQMVTAEGDPFEIEIAPFVLTEPYTVH
jgi:ApaG protein